MILPVQSNAPQKQQTSSKVAVRAAPTNAEMDVLKLKKAWEVALAPVKQLPMTAIMMYMSGNSLQIFSIMMVVMAFKNPLVGLMATNQAFERFETEGTKANMLMVKALYVAMQILALALGVWKVNGMGLLPYVHSSSWPIRLLKLVQDNEIRLVGLGSCESTDGDSNTCVLIDGRFEFVSERYSEEQHDWSWNETRTKTTKIDTH